MHKPTIVLTTALIATLISAGKTFAQSLPDEINHPQYLRVYQNLDQVLQTKTAEFNKLATEKADLESMIQQMERDQRDLPTRNNNLQSTINQKNQELVKINSDIGALEAVLGQVVIDLNNMDAVLKQLSADLRNQNITAAQLEEQRKNVRMVIAQVDVRLQRELSEEDQSIRLINGYQDAIQTSRQKMAELDRDKRELMRNVDSFKRDLPKAKSDLSVNLTALNDKKPKLKEAQDKLVPVRAEITSQKSKLTQIDADLAPLKSKIASLKAELERLSPEIKRLEQENKSLRDKIKSNKEKISSVGLEALKTKVTTIEKDMESLTAQSKTATEALVAAQEAIKPDIGQLNEVMKKIRELQRSGANPAELARLKNEQSAIETRIAPKRTEIARLNKQVETIAIALAPKQTQLSAAQDAVTKAESSIGAMTNEIADAESKIATNEAAISVQAQSNSGVVGQIKDAEAALKPLQDNRDAVAANVSTLEKQETGLNTTVTALAAEVKRLETDTAAQTQNVTMMEKAVNEAPNELRRIDNHARQLNETLIQKSQEMSREQKLLERITRDRIAVQREMNDAQNGLNAINENLRQTVETIKLINDNIAQQSQQRDAAVRYNQDSINKRDVLRASKAAAEKVITESSQEITDNNTDLQTIARQLPINRSDLNVITPKVAAAGAAVQDAQKKSDDAEMAFQNRLSLYEKYLASAKSLGIEKAQIGNTDGVKSGALDAKAKASKLATENASAQAKWEALRRGYVRGEITGFVTGRDIGLSNLSEASRGETEGKIAGALRAKNQAELVLKPAFYLEELDRRIKEDVISKRSKSTLAASVSDEVNSLQSSANNKSMMENEDIPALTQNEINQAAGIISALDSLIDQSSIELNNILINRSRISDPRAAYSMPGQGENALTANCSTVYKSVKEFVDACKTEYTARYQGLYESAHKSTFVSEYPAAFKSQVDNVFGPELARLYPGYLKEASNVGKDVGINVGKQEIYRQNFERSEVASYVATLPVEESRVDGEATALVSDYINSNGVLTVSSAKLEKEGSFVIPGATVNLTFEAKNVGQVATTGTSLVRVLESANLVLASREGTLGVVNPRTIAKLPAISVAVNEAAIPGTVAFIAGEIVHPGNKYKATRVEYFRVEKVIGVNPAVETAIEIDTSPKVNNIFGIKKHDINFTVVPKYNGVDQGYSISLEEMGSTYATILTAPVSTPVLGRGASKKVTFTYKLEKASKGKTVTLRVTVKNGESVVKVQDYQIQPN